MKKGIFLMMMYVSLTQWLFSATTPIDQANYTVVNYSSDNTTHPVIHAFDGDDATWWALWNSAGYDLPGIVEIDLGTTYQLDGFSYLANPANSSDKALGYEIYTSTDGLNWGVPVAVGIFNWVSNDDVSEKVISFGAVSAQFAKVVYVSNVNPSSNNVHTGDLKFYEDPYAIITQTNQIITESSISQKYSTASNFTSSAVASSGLELTYTILSGPASVNGNEISLTGDAGIVEVKIEQLGNTSFYPVEVIETFEVIDLSAYWPTVSTRLTENYPIEMANGLHAYPIYVYSDIEYSEMNSIENVTISINSIDYVLEQMNSYYLLLWTPEDFGEYIIEITAYGSNATSTSLTKTISVVSEVASQTVTSLEDVVIEFGSVNSRDYSGFYKLPQHLNSYNKIIGTLEVECPNGNCDDWDRKAYIDIKAPDGNWIQLIRYMTPYNVGCNHQIDLTDYESLMQGEVEFRVFIDTWGTGGWQLTLDLEMTAGEPEFIYSKVDEIWDATYDLGNPDNVQPVDTIEYSYDESILSSHMRLSSTGHGWGGNNSQNAAEFYEATNFIDVDGVEFFEQHLWNNCNPNPDNCIGQQGTWQYSRAGWCPGAIAHPNIIDFTNQITEGNVKLTYKFDPTYIDYCHPNNPDCVTGVTCADCDDTYKAIYFVDAHLINYSNSPELVGVNELEYVNISNIYELSIYPNPSKGSFKVQSNFTGSGQVSIQTVSGDLMLVRSFKNSDDLENYTFDLSAFQAGIYFITVENNLGMGVKKIVKQ